MSLESESRSAAPRPVIGDPGPALTFIFTMLTMCFWGIYAGIYDGPTELAVGLVQLACFLPYLVAAVLLFVRGDSMNGNIFLIFAALFGAVGGFLNIAAGLMEPLGFTMCTQLAAIPFLWGAIVLVPMLASIWKTASAAASLCFASIIIFLTLMALVGLGVLPESANVIIKWLCLFAAVDGFYTAINALLDIGGLKKFPEGRPIGLWFAGKN
jgi:hypothetical protein